MRWGELLIYCAECGEQFDQNNHPDRMFESLSKNHVCSKECCEALMKRYCVAILDPLKGKKE